MTAGSRVSRSWLPSLALGAYAVGTAAWLLVRRHGLDYTAAFPSGCLVVPHLVTMMIVGWLLYDGQTRGWRRLGWWLLLAGTLDDLVSTLCWTYLSSPSEPPLGTWLDVPYLLDDFLLAAAYTAFFMDAGGTFRSRRVWLEAATLALGLFAAQLPFLVDPLLGIGTSHAAVAITTLAYTFCNAVMGTSAALLFMRLQSWRSDPTAMLIVLAAGIGMVFDVSSVEANVRGLYPIGAVDNIADSMYYALIVAAVAAERRWGRCVVQQHLPEDGAHAFTPVLVVLIAVAIALGAQAEGTRLNLVFVGILVMICGLLLVVRQRTVHAELMRLNAALVARQSEARLTELVRRSADAIIVVGRDGEISYASPAAATVLDVAPEAVPGSAAMALLGVDNQAAMRLFLERLSSQRPLQAGLEVDLKCASGPKSLHILASDQRANPLLEGIVLTLRDVTEQRTLEREILRIAQRERRRLCGGLHEGVGQELAGISLLLKSLANSRGADADSLRLALEPIVRHVNGTMDVIRALARGIAPLQVVHGSLASALKGLAEELSERSRCQVLFDADDADLGIGEDAAEHLYRIAQEAMNNAARHSGCTRIEVELRIDHGFLKLTVTDNGRGLPQLAGTGGRGLGLRLAHYRARLMRGSVRFDRPHGGGTCVEVRVPVASRRIVDFRLQHAANGDSKAVSARQGSAHPD